MATSEDLIPNPVRCWSAIALELNRLDHSIEPALRRAPGIAASARAFGLIHMAMAEACANAPGGDFRPLRVFRPIDAAASLDAAIGAAAATALRAVYGRLAVFEDPIGESEALHVAHLRANAPAGVDIDAGLAAGRGIGGELAAAWDHDRLNALHAADCAPLGLRGGHDHDPDEPHLGRPDPEARLRARRMYGARWGAADPFALSRHEVTGLAPPAPPPLNSPAYVNGYVEARDTGRRSGSTRKGDETKVGLFWAYDSANRIGSPPRLYNQIVGEILAAETPALTTPEWARALALCNVAMADAGIVTFWAKYAYNLWRPVVGIRRHVRDPATPPAASIDPAWRPLGSPATNSDGEGRDFTPNSPSYPSAHATIGAACFTALEMFRRDRGAADAGAIDLTFVSDELNGDARPAAPRAFRRIEKLIEENSRSRVFLGVNWSFDTTEGAKSGAAVARAVVARAWKPGASIRPRNHISHGKE